MSSGKDSQAAFFWGPDRLADLATDLRDVSACLVATFRRLMEPSDFAFCSVTSQAVTVLSRYLAKMSTTPRPSRVAVGPTRFPSGSCQAQRRCCVATRIEGQSS